MESNPDKLLYPKNGKPNISEKNEKAFMRLHSDPVGSCSNTVPRSMIFSAADESKAAI